MKRYVLPILVCGALLLSGCQNGLSLNMPQLGGARMSDEERVAAVLDDVQRGIEAHRIYKVLAHLSRSYFDKEGRDYAAMQEQLTQVFEKYSRMRVTRVRPRIAVAGGRAQAVETFALTADPQNRNEDPPVEWQGRVTIYLALIGNTWKIVEVGPVR